MFKMGNNDATTQNNKQTHRNIWSTYFVEDFVEPSVGHFVEHFIQILIYFFENCAGGVNGDFGREWGDGGGGVKKSQIRLNNVK